MAAFPFNLSEQTRKSLTCLLILSLIYSVMSYIAYTVIHMNHITPLDHNAPLNRFSEARALDHIRKLSVDIEGRQEGKKGLEDAAEYIKGQLLSFKDRAGSHLKVEIDEALVSGSFNMTFLSRSIALGYRNHKNILMRISPRSSTENDTSILVNAHFDSPLGSPGAGDCGSCVASLLELARLVVDSSWVPPRPLIFLFNGAEELFLLGSHGFVKTHKWSGSVGAFINLEATGTGGLDLVVQSGPGTWPSQVYVQSAKHPMANSAAQDVFGIVPGDTDYRIFAQDHGNAPGLDIVFILGGYYYHTAYDTIERLMPGSIQARGDNMINLIMAFASSPMMPSVDKASLEAPLQNNDHGRAIFFDYLSLFMVFYSRKVALVLHTLPVVIFFLMSMFTCSNISPCSWFATLANMLKGVLFHAVGVVLAIIIPVVFAIVRLLFSSHAMSWFANPCLAFAMFVPSAVIGLLIPRTIWGYSHVSSYDKASNEALTDEAHFWGAFGLYSFITMAYLLAGLGGGFLTFFTSASMIPAWVLFSLAKKKYGNQTFKSLAGYLIPLVPCLTYNVYFGGFLVQFLIEKMAMMGSLPPPYGYFIPDIIVALIIGAVTGLCVGPVVPVACRWLANSSILQFLMQLTVITLALSSQFFPYSVAAPKRVVLQHKILTSDSSKILDSSYEFSVVDANSFDFLFKNVPEVASYLEIGSNISFTEDYYSEKSSWVVLFPVSFLFTGSMKFPAKNDDAILKQYKDMPHLSIHDQYFTTDTGRRRMHLELSLGSLGEIWATALNITGPLTNWSFADNKIPAPESDGGGPPSYILRLTGKSVENWTFWLEAGTSEALRVDLAVLDQYLVDDTKKLKGLFPDWIDVTAFSTFFSNYTF